MIVKMKEVTLLCLERNRSEALEALRDLGVMHVKQLGRVESDDVAELTRKITDAVKVYNILSGRKVSGESGENIAPERLVSEALELLDEEASVTKQRENLLKEMEKLAPWGNFEPETVRKLRESGVHVYLCSSFKSDFPKLSFPADAAVKVINRGRNDVYYMVVSQVPVNPAELQTVQLPDISLVKLQDLVRKGDDRLSDISRQLDVLALSCKCLRGYKESMEKDLEFAQNRDGMTGEGEIAYLQGYVPVTEVEKLRAEALKQGWALKIDDPAEDDMKVPTCIKKPKWMRIIDPLFDFIGIAPGYRENDVSLFFLIAFPIFFGMLIGDFAYGVLFMTTAFLCKYLFRKKEAAQMPLNLLILLSAFSIIFGLLQGACLGLPREILPAPLKGLDFLADPKNSPSACKLAEKLKIADPMDLKDKFIQWFCFLLAALHLSSARVFKTITEIRNWRSWGNLGWAFLIWGNFFTAVNLIVFPGTFPLYFAGTLYGVGILLIVVTITGEAALNLPFSIIGSFVDVLSYIRLFAVGLSGVYVGTCFNDMGRMVMDSLPQQLLVIGVAGLILVAVCGHALNILLGIMGVMVHAIRLNTLEFSNHIEMQWTGIKYRPFAKEDKSEIQ